jgi:hypothetical protein
VTHPISIKRDGMRLSRSGQTVRLKRLAVVPEAALMRAAMTADDEPSPMRVLAAQLQEAIRDHGYAPPERAQSRVDDLERAVSER